VNPGNLISFLLLLPMRDVGKKALPDFAGVVLPENEIKTLFC
jgi:hypothetical protein